MAEKLLDVLVPAYGDVKGVEKILSRIGNEQRCRLIVSDDSTDATIINNIKDICLRYNATYKMGPRSGAVSNWNFLLSHAKSTYCVLVHHDECFSNTNFIDELEKNTCAADILVLPVVVVNSNNVARYVYSWQQRLLIRFFRPFGPMLNILAGPTATFIFKTNKSCDFHPNLVYQVDCEWYTRILSDVENKNIFFFDGTSVLSTFLSGSITDTIRVNLKEIIESDKRVLEQTSWGGMMKKWSYFSHLITFLSRLVMLPSYVPFYFKRIFQVKDVNR